MSHTVHLLSRLVLANHDFAPDATTPVAIAWVDMRARDALAVGFRRTSGAGTMTLALVANTASDGSGTDVPVATWSGAQPDAVGDQIWLETDAQAIAAAAAAAGVAHVRYLSAVASCSDASATGVVTYMATNSRPHLVVAATAAPPPPSQPATKYSAAGIVVDAATNAVLANLDARTVDIVPITDSNGFIDSYGWAVGMDQGLAANGAQAFAGQLSGAAGTGGRGGTTSSTAPALTGWTEGDDTRGFGSLGIHRSAYLPAASFSSDVFMSVIRSSLPVTGYASADLLNATDALYHDLYYMTFNAGGGAHRHATRRDTSNGVGGGSTTLDGAALNVGDGWAKHTRTIAADGANTTLYGSGAFGGAWGQSYAAQCGIIGYRWRHQTRTAGWACSLLYQGGGTTQYDVATEVAVASKIASWQWYAARLRADQLALGATPAVLVLLTHAVNDAGDASLSVDGINPNNTAAGYTANTMQIIDFFRDYYPGAPTELHFLLVPGFAMDAADTGKDVAHQAILGAAETIALAEPRVGFYSFRQAFDGADMLAHDRWRSGGADKNHLDIANGYVPLATDLWAQMLAPRAFA
jgi:hypothetical protein